MSFLSTPSSKSLTFYFRFLKTIFLTVQIDFQLLFLILKVPILSYFEKFSDFISVLKKNSIVFEKIFGSIFEKFPTSKISGIGKIFRSVEKKFSTQKKIFQLRKKNSDRKIFSRSGKFFFKFGKNFGSKIFQNPGKYFRIQNFFQIGIFQNRIYCYYCSKYDGL